jgi:hypothetical protein
MTIKRDNAGVIVLAGECPVDDAETLLQLLQAQPEGPVDWSGCTRLHTAVLQMLMASAPAMRGECGDAFVARWGILKSPVTPSPSHAK